ncbi:MAG: penicillin acylase family protein, partial [Chloroflexi bacterium]|nr:penicillin acylase family protein [Chloroflexota bacterium]
MLKQLFTAWSRKRLPQVNGRLYLPSLHQPVTIQRDKWGIPHIHAANRHDLFLAQGFVHAQDRLWQMELNRRAAKGTLSAVFGKLTLDTDRLSRTLGFNRLAHHNWAHFNGKARADLLAYTDGVNAYLAQQKPLPIEFSLVQHTPEPWLPVDSLAYGRLQMWALTHGAVGEWIYAQVLDKVGAKMGAELGMYYPDGNPITLSDGIDVQALNVKQVLETAVMPFHGKGSLDGAGRGSNGWVIDADKSSTGHAILCNDMHLPVGTPSLWHIQHLRSDDGFHATGFTQPGFPYVMVGHNDNISWGATLSYVDCEDLFVEKFHPTEPDM